MKWNTLDELPENGSLVRVKLPGKRPFLCLYQNDSFGLGDKDFEITDWLPYQLRTFRYLRNHHYKPKSTQQAWDHSNLHSSELSLNLVH